MFKTFEKTQQLPENLIMILNFVLKKSILIFIQERSLWYLFPAL
jgi:hypothetical protein